MKLQELFEEDTKAEAKSLGDLKIMMAADGGIKQELIIDTSINQTALNIDSLDGGPKIVRGKFSLRNMKNLQSLVGGPEEVGSFAVMDCDLRSLEGFPKKVESGDVTLTLNPKLGSLKGLADIDGELYMADCGLTSLKGCPEKVKEFSCARNPLTSLEHCPRMVDNEFIAHHCELTSLHNIHKHIDYIGSDKSFTVDFDLTDNPIKSHVLGLLKIKGNFTVKLSNVKVKKIINKYLRGNRNMLECQQELIDAGFEEFAQL
jgi:hypothetical protein